MSQALKQSRTDRPINQVEKSIPIRQFHVFVFVRTFQKFALFYLKEKRKKNIHVIHNSINVIFVKTV